MTGSFSSCSCSYAYSRTSTRGRPIDNLLFKLEINRPITSCPRWIFPAGSPVLSIRSVNFTPDPAAPEPGAPRGPRVADAAEAELVRQMQAGDEQAFATFYDKFAPGLFSMIYAILHDHKEAEDVLQEAFVQMWKRTATYDATRSSLFTWAVMISRHKAIDHLRARERQSRLVETVAEEANDFATSAPADRADYALERSDERERVRAAMAQLGEGQREVVELAFFAGLAQTQIAEKLGAPLGTIKARIRRGLIALREMLGAVSS